MIGYPNAKKVNTEVNKKVSAANRGMTLEADLNLTNQYYLDTGRAVIYKKPTPIQIVTVDYPSRNAAKITEAYFKVPSTTDYNGVYRGLPIDFEAKETKAKTSFPFKMIHPHQITHLKRVYQQQAVCFLIIRFTAYDETYYVDAMKLIKEYELHKKASLPISWFKENGILIPFKLNPRIDYLTIIDKIYLKEEKHD